MLAYVMATSVTSYTARRLWCAGIWTLGSLVLAGLLVEGCARRETVRRSADEWYALGSDQMARKKYAKAGSAFSQMLEQHPQDRRRPETLLSLTEALYFDKKYEEAKFQARRFLEIYPAHPEADKAQYYAAMAAFQRLKTVDRDQSITWEALQEFQRLLQAYPRSEFVEEAKQKVAACRDRLAATELYVGRFYYRKGAYPAAIGRLAQLLQTYPEAAIADEVLFLLGDAYTRNQNRQEAAGAFDELVKHYPKSRYASTARARLAALR
jgi:outer membrane protein assembly factor BamD